MVGKGTGRQTVGTALNKESKRGQAMVMSKRAEGADCLGAIHIETLQHFDYRQNIEMMWCVKSF